MDSETTIDDFPDDILLHLFSYFTFNDLITCIQNVCTRWQLLIHNKMSWNYFEYNPKNDVRDKEIIHFLKEVPRLQNLILRKRSVGHGVLNSITENCSCLTRLEFNAKQKLSAKFLECLLSKCSGLEHIHLPNKIINRIECSKIIASFQNLKILSIGHYANFHYGAILTPLGDGCPALQHLNIMYEMHTYDDLGYFLDKKKDQLISLDVGWTSVDSKNTLPLLPVCKSLKTLHLDAFYDAYYSDSDDITITPYFEPFSRLHSVTSLTLSELNQIECEELIGVFSNRTMNQLLELQIFRYNQYTDRLGCTIIDNCPQLKLLYLWDLYPLTYKSVEFLHTLHELENLGITFSSVSEKEMISLTNCENLKVLDLRYDDQLSEKCLQQITRFRSLKVLKLKNCDVKGFPFHLFPSDLKQLTHLSLKFARNVNQLGLIQLKLAMPYLRIDDFECSLVDENGDEVSMDS